MIRHYKAREGVHGEWCIDIGKIEFVREKTIGIAATEEDAEKIAWELNKLSGNKEYRGQLKTYKSEECFKTGSL